MSQPLKQRGWRLHLPSEGSVPFWLTGGELWLWAAVSREARSVGVNSRRLVISGSFRERA